MISRRFYIVDLSDYTVDDCRLILTVTAELKIHFVTALRELAIRGILTDSKVLQCHHTFLHRLGPLFLFFVDEAGLQRLCFRYI